MLNSAFSENIAGEIPYIVPIFELMNEDENRHIALVVLLVIMGAIPEVISLSLLIDFQIYQLLEELINKSDEPLGAMVLLKSLKTFEMLNDADEYIFDEDKNTKNEIKKIFNLLTSQDESFWNKQKMMLGEVFSYTEKLILTNLLSLIREYSVCDFVQNILLHCLVLKIILNNLRELLFLFCLKVPILYS